jgi:hypothetical protein
MKVAVPEPRAAQWTWKDNWVVFERWDAQSQPLPVVLSVGGRGKSIAKITNIPLNQGVTVYVTMKTLGLTDFARHAQVPLVIEEPDIQDVARGNVVRIVVVDPKKEHQTARFVQLRLSPTEDAMKRAKEIGEPLLVAVLGNREPRFRDWRLWGKEATPY